MNSNILLAIHLIMVAATFSGCVDNEATNGGLMPTVDENETIPPRESPDEVGFRISPTVTLRPINSVINKSQDGLVELCMNNPSMNNATLIVDMQFGMPSGVFVHGEDLNYDLIEETVDGKFEILPGTDQMIEIIVETKEAGDVTIHFAGVYYSNSNGDVMQELSMTHTFTVEPEHKSPVSTHITAAMNETIDLPDHSVTCTIIRNIRHQMKAGSFYNARDDREIRISIEINATDNTTTGLKHWWIRDESGRDYFPIHHVDVHPMRHKHVLSAGDSMRAILYFGLPGGVTDFTLMYNCTNFDPSQIVYWTVGSPTMQDFVRPSDGFVRYPIQANAGPNFVVMDGVCTTVREEFIFRADGGVTFRGSHRRGFGSWVLVESGDQRNVYNVSHDNGYHIINFDVGRTWSCNEWERPTEFSSGSGGWKEV